MRELDTLIGEIVTIKSSTGLEFIGSLTEINREENYITIAEPRAISMTADEMVRIMPYTLTGNPSLVGINLSSILTIVGSLTQTAEDYRNMIAAEYAAELQEKRDAELEEA